MPDRESVITHLQIIHTWAEFAREHDLQFFTPKHLKDIAEWTEDALELLKEQEDLGTELTNAVELIHKKNERIKKLLKEQEAVKPTWSRGKPFCGACGLRIRSGGKFCSECGKPIAWEGR